MDIRYINPFMSAIQNVFKTMLSVEAVIGKPQVKKEVCQHADVSAIIGFSGAVTGTIVLSFPADLACKIASSFAGLEVDLKHPDLTDALGELANMVAGNAKAKLEGEDIRLSLPNVVIGHDHHIPKSRSCPSIVIPCKLEWGGFVIEVSMKQTAVPAPVGAGA